MGSYTVGQLLWSESPVKYYIVRMIAGTLVNAIADHLFIFTFNMQVKGAAIAAILGNTINLILQLSYYTTNKTLLHFVLRKEEPK